MSKVDDTWSAIFRSLKMADELDRVGVAVVTADQIKRITRGTDGLGQQEPRLMTKFDVREQRARTLREHDCTILATSNGTYSVLVGDGYHDVEEIDEVQSYSSSNSDSLETLPAICASESQVIDTACASGLLGDFLGEDVLSMTIRGRLRSGPFNFAFDAHRVIVDRVQIEVDAGYEGKRIYLIEAKMGTKDNFITRQLYYPLRMWSERGVSKSIVPVFITYSNKTFCIYEYRFSILEQYNSIELVKHGAFVLDGASAAATAPLIGRYTSRSFLKSVLPNKKEDSTPFPQADDIRKVIDAIFAVANGYSSTKDIADHYDFDPRQSYYYGNAAKYLGFLDLKYGDYSLTNEGKVFVDSPKGERNAMMLAALAASPTINALLREMVEIGDIPSTNAIASRIQEFRPEINGTTALRRAATMKNWLEWASRNTSQ